MPAFKGDKLLDILKKQGSINDQQYDQVKTEALNNNQDPEFLLYKHNITSEEEIAKAKAILLKVPYVDVATTSVVPEALQYLPEVVAEKFLALPLSVDKDQKLLTVAMANPVDLQAMDFLEKKAGMRIVPKLGQATDLKKAIQERYAQSLSTEVSEALKDTAASRPAVKMEDSQDLGGVIRAAPIAKVVSTILEFAIKARASDVHIEPLEEKTRVRYRIDGIMHEKLVLPRSVHESVVSRIKVLSNMKIDEKRVPQDGRFNFTSGTEEVDLRVSTLPSIHGEKVVMRLLKKTAEIPDLPELGLRGKALTNVETAIRMPHGIILITGPTGSGKTTTLYSILNRINKPTVNIITLEDPVEYQLAGINQVQVHPQAGLTFASGLRSFLRQDPDIIMVGEVRDKETAELAIQASLTGHLVFSTLHTNSAAGALPRLLDMEMEPFLLASSMSLVAAQRVVRRLCPHCRQKYSPPAEMEADIRKVLGNLYQGFMQSKKMAKLELYKPGKCEQCNETGYRDRVGIFEVLPINERIGRLILERAPVSKIERQAEADGMVSMKQDGYLKVMEGLTSMEEVLRVAES